MKNNRLKWLAILLGLWFFFYPKPYDLLFIIVMILPILSIFIYGFKNSSFISWYKLKETGDGKYYYNSGNAINFATWFVTCRILIDFSFLDSILYYYPIGIAMVMVLVLIFMPGNSAGFKPRKMLIPKFWLSLMLGLNILLYLFTVTYGINNVFDYTKPTIYKVEVLKKYASSYKVSKSYYLVLTSWDELNVSKIIRVNETIYDSLKVNDRVQVNSKKGLLGIPWYYIPGNNIVDKYIQPG